MKAGSQKLLPFSFKDKMSQKKIKLMTKSKKLLNVHEKDAILEFAKLWHDHSTAKCSLG